MIVALIRPSEHTGVWDRGVPMHVWIDQDSCTGAGLCVDRCPELFIVLEDGLGYVLEHGGVVGEPGRARPVPLRHAEAAIDAAEHCPGECIYLEVGSGASPQRDTDFDDAGNCSNRSPYPTLHLLREDSVERAVEAYPDPDVIVERNLDTLEKLGSDGYHRLLEP